MKRKEAEPEVVITPVNVEQQSTETTNTNTTNVSVISADDKTNTNSPPPPTNSSYISDQALIQLLKSRLRLSSFLTLLSESTELDLPKNVWEKFSKPVLILTKTVVVSTKKEVISKTFFVDHLTLHSAFARLVRAYQGIFPGITEKDIEVHEGYCTSVAPTSGTPQIHDSHVVLDKNIPLFLLNTNNPHNTIILFIKINK